MGFHQNTENCLSYILFIWTWGNTTNKKKPKPILSVYEWMMKKKKKRNSYWLPIVHFLVRENCLWLYIFTHLEKSIYICESNAINKYKTIYSLYTLELFGMSVYSDIDFWDCLKYIYIYIRKYLQKVTYI